jgi:hypothetical protein
VANRASSTALAPPPSSSTPVPVPTTRPSSSGTVNAAGEWFYTEKGQKSWVDAMELTTLTPDMPALLNELGQHYDAERLSAALETRQGELTRRAVRVVARLGGFFSLLLADAAAGRLESSAPKRAVQLRGVITGLGPSFIKVGQALSCESGSIKAPRLPCTHHSHPPTQLLTPNSLPPHNSLIHYNTNTKQQQKKTSPP